MGDHTIESYLNPVLYVLALLLAGILIRYFIKLLAPRFKRVSSGLTLVFRILNLFVLWVVLPTVVFVSIARYTSRQIMGFGNAIIFAFAGLGVCFVLATVISFLTKADRKESTALVINSAFMNVSYLGLPMVYALVGTSGLGPASIYAVGIGVLHLIFGIVLASSTKKKRVNLRFLFGNVLTFPVTFALIAALLFVGLGAFSPTVIQETFDIYLAKPFFALMLLVVGYQMPVVNPRKHLRALGIVGALRFIVCPIITLVMIWLIGLNVATDLSPKPALIQSVMPPAIFNMILAHNFKLDLKLYGAIIFYLTFVSLFVALPILIYFTF